MSETKLCGLPECTRGCAYDPVCDYQPLTTAPSPVPPDAPDAAVEGLAAARCPCGHLVHLHERYPYLDGVVCKGRFDGTWCTCDKSNVVALLASDWLAERDRVRDDEAEQALDDALRERDEAQEWADRLAYAIASIEVIGEHSSANNPWENALDIAAGPDAIAEAEQRGAAKVAERVRAMAQEWFDAANALDNDESARAFGERKGLRRAANELRAAVRATEEGDRG